MSTDEPILTTTGHALTPSVLRRGLLVSVTSSMMGSVWAAGAVGVALTMYLYALGASGLQIGLATTVQQVAVLAQIPSSMFAERLRARRAYWGWTALPHRAVWFIPVTLALCFPHAARLNIWVMIATVTIGAMLGHASSPVWQSWLADLVPDRIAGRFWGTRQTAVMFSYVIGAWGAGRILDRYPDTHAAGGTLTGFVWVFGLSAVFGCGDIIQHLFVPEPRPHPRDGAKPVLTRMVHVLRQRDVRYVVASLAVWVFACNIVGPFGMVYLKQEYDATYVQLSAFAVASALGSLAAGIPLGRAIDRLGARSMGSLAMVLTPLIGLAAWFLLTHAVLTFHVPLVGAVAVPQYVLMLTVSSFVGGALASGIGLCQLQLINTLTPRPSRMITWAVAASVVGLVAAIGPLAGGGLMDLFQHHPMPWHTPMGQPLSYFHLLLVIYTILSVLVAAPILMSIPERGQGLHPALNVALLSLGYPWRTLRRIQGIVLPRFMWPFYR